MVLKRGRDPGPLFRNFDPAQKSDGRLTGDGIHAILARLGNLLEPPIIVRPHGSRHSAITAALDATNGNARAARKFSRHRSIEVLLRYDDNRADLAGEVARLVGDSLIREQSQEDTEPSP